MNKVAFCVGLLFVLAACHSNHEPISSKPGDEESELDVDDDEDADSERDVEMETRESCSSVPSAGTAGCPFSLGGSCPGHPDMAAIAGTCSCVDLYESVVSLNTDCRGPYLGQNADDYSATTTTLPKEVDCCGEGCPAKAPMEQGTHVACSLPGVKPSGFLSWYQARRVCRNAGKDLCEDQEWERACQGQGGAVYPYGRTYEPCFCQTIYKLGLAEIEPPDDPLVQATGSDSHCRSFCGAYDMVGNLSEWVKQGGEDPGSGRLAGGDTLTDPASGGSTCVLQPKGAPNTFSSRADLHGVRCCVRFASATTATRAQPVAAFLEDTTRDLKEGNAFSAYLDVPFVPTWIEGPGIIGAVGLKADGYNALFILVNSAFVDYGWPDSASSGLPVISSAGEALISIKGNGLARLHEGKWETLQGTASLTCPYALAALSKDYYLVAMADGTSYVVNQGNIRLQASAMGAVTFARRLVAIDPDNWILFGKGMEGANPGTLVKLRHQGVTQDFVFPNLSISADSARVYSGRYIFTDPAGTPWMFTPGEPNAVTIVFSTCHADRPRSVTAWKGRIYVATDMLRVLSVSDGAEAIDQLRHPIPGLPLGMWPKGTTPVGTPEIILLRDGQALYAWLNTQTTVPRFYRALE